MVLASELAWCREEKHLGIGQHTSILTTRGRGGGAVGLVESIRCNWVQNQQPVPVAECSRQWPEVYDSCHTFLHVQKRATKSDTSGHCLECSACSYPAEVLLAKNCCN